MGVGKLFKFQQGGKEASPHLMGPQRHLRKINFIMGIKGTIDEYQWRRNLSTMGVEGRRQDRIIGKCMCSALLVLARCFERPARNELARCSHELRALQLGERARSQPPSAPAPVVEDGTTRSSRVAITTCPERA